MVSDGSRLTTKTQDELIIEAPLSKEQYASQDEPVDAPVRNSIHASNTTRTDSEADSKLHGKAENLQTPQNCTDVVKQKKSDDKPNSMQHQSPIISEYTDQKCIDKTLTTNIQNTNTVTSDTMDGTDIDAIYTSAPVADNINDSEQSCEHETSSQDLIDESSELTEMNISSDSDEASDLDIDEYVVLN